MHDRRLHLFAVTPASMLAHVARQSVWADLMNCFASDLSPDAKAEHVLWWSATAGCIDLSPGVTGWRASDVQLAKGRSDEFERLLGCPAPLHEQVAQCVLDTKATAYQSWASNTPSGVGAAGWFTVPTGDLLEVWCRWGTPPWLSPGHHRSWERPGSVAYETPQRLPRRK